MRTTNPINMKTLTVIFLLTLSIAHSNAQTFDEWFNQKKTQTKYLIEQIIAYQVYLDYLKKGYTIAHNGLTAIENIKNGNFNLDRDFFKSLKTVKPSIHNSVKVIDIIAFQYSIIRDMKNVYQFCQTNKHFTPEEVRYVARVHTSMLLLCDASISELHTIIQSDAAQMTDDERLQRIDKIHEDMKDKKAFVRAFGNDTKLLAHEREKEGIEINQLRKNYESI
ncbi:MAG: hypothetical protein OJF59_001820 [Cytophagales bacterium]|jgi:hypothetical protein|nr:MAG: hypothetical protein OJF59_001820 [Cytophagales bacterium]